MKTPITYYGGKQKLLKKILGLIPPHHAYVEAFVGGGAVFFGKERSEVEVINDTNQFVTNFYEQCMVNFEKLQFLVTATLHSRAAHEKAHIVYQHPILFPKVRKAWAFWVLCNQGFGGMISKTWGFGKKTHKSELRTKNKRDTFLPEIKERLARTQIESIDAVKLIVQRDAPDTFFYLDPPYFNADMGHYGGYTEADFVKLLDALSCLKGKFLLSSYPSSVLSEYIERNGWKTIQIEQRVCVSSKGKMKTEVLTYNYSIHS